MHTRHFLTALTAAAALGLAGCGGSNTLTVNTPPAPPVATSSARIPISDMSTATYLGFRGGLYPNGNAMPAEHYNAGIQRANAIQPLDGNGQPNPNGKMVLMSLGMSNTTQEWCTDGSSLTCNSWTFSGQALADPAVNHRTLMIVNGAAGGQTTATWDSPSDSNYDRVRDQRLAPLGLTEKQVQIAWVKQANAQPTSSLPASDADAYQLEQGLGDVIRSMKVRYPNLKMVFLSSRIYGGYATTGLNPEPYAYEGGFSVKWLIEAQIRQNLAGTVDAKAGDLNYSNSTAPWLAWSAYLWADGMNPRSDGLTWATTDLRDDDHTHPSPAGQQKVGTLLLQFFKTSPHTQCWFLASAPPCQ
jgi:hypothetical protein